MHTLTTYPVDVLVVTCKQNVEPDFFFKDFLFQPK